MDIIKTINDKDLTVKVSGRLDTNTSGALEEELNASLDGMESLTLDFSDLEYMSSSGLRILLVYQKRMNKQGTMKLVHVNDFIMDILQMTGFADILTIE